MFPGEGEGVVDGADFDGCGLVQRSGGAGGCGGHLFLDTVDGIVFTGWTDGGGSGGAAFGAGGVHVHADRFAVDGNIAGFVVDFDHPVVQASVGVPHDVVEDYELLKLFTEVLLELLRPNKSAWATPVR